jgi:uncharacterized protein (TIGR02145 family)
MQLYALTTLALALAFTSCESFSSNTFTDSRDNKTYKWVTIGTQTWMAENLNYDAKGSECYDENRDNCAKYGRLYSWETAKTACPSGWHLPTKKEWDALLNYVESDKKCTNCASKYLKAKSGWEEGGNGLDAYGFAALPGGGSGNYDSEILYAGSSGSWWSSSVYYAKVAYRRIMNMDDKGNDDWKISDIFSASVRCIKNGDNAVVAAIDYSSAPQTFTSSIRPNEKIIPGKTYTDMLEYANYFASQYSAFVSMKKGNQQIDMVFGGKPELNRGEVAEIEWKMDIDQGESGPYMREHLAKVKKLKKQPAAAGTNYSSALQTHFAKGTLGESGKTRPIEMFFQKVSKNGKIYDINGKSKTKAAEDTFSGTLGVSSDVNYINIEISCGSGEKKIGGDYRLEEKKSKTSGYFSGEFSACEKSGKFSKAKFEGSWIKHSNGEATPCSFGL